MKPGTCYLISLLMVSPSNAQDTAFIPFYKNIQSTDILFGIHWQGNARENITHRYYEIGVARGQYFSHPHGITAGAIYASEEIYFGAERTIFGTKVGAWAHYLLDLGLALIYYTDFQHGSVKVRPELGVGMGRLRAVAGYNVPAVGNKGFEAIRRNNVQLSIQLTWGVKKKTLDRDATLFKSES